MMSVEYVAPANDGRGRLYARQIGAQSLPRQLRLLFYGDTHKEVDISGAHYELTRALCKSQSLPSICVLRDWFKVLWTSRLACDTSGDVGRAIKLFPIRVINCGALFSNVLAGLDLVMHIVWLLLCCAYVLRMELWADLRPYRSLEAAGYMIDRRRYEARNGQWGCHPSKGWMLQRSRQEMHYTKGHFRLLRWLLIKN